LYSKKTIFNSYVIKCAENQLLWVCSVVYDSMLHSSIELLYNNNDVNM